MNNAAISMGVQISVQVPVFTSVEYIPRSGIAEQMVFLFFLIFLSNFNSNVTYSISMFNFF